jgi:hypothetical protein
MKNVTLTWILSILSMAMLLTGCEIIGDIFKAGMWVGIIIVVLVAGLVFWLVRKIGGK